MVIRRPRNGTPHQSPRAGPSSRSAKEAEAGMTTSQAGWQQTLGGHAARRGLEASFVSRRNAAKSAASRAASTAGSGAMGGSGRDQAGSPVSAAIQALRQAMKAPRDMMLSALWMAGRKRLRSVMLAALKRRRMRG